MRKSKLNLQTYTTNKLKDRAAAFRRHICEMLPFYLHAVVDVVDHREALSVLHALPVLRGPLPGTYNPILALGGRDGEVLPGVGLGGDGVGLWTGRGGLVLMKKKKQKTK